MAGRRPDEVFTLGLDIDPSAANQQNAKFQRAMLKMVGDLHKAVSKGHKASTDMADEAADATEKWGYKIEEVNHHYIKQVGEIGKLEEALLAAQKAAAGATGDEKNNLKKAIKGYKQQIDLQKKSANEYKKSFKPSAKQKKWAEALQDLRSDPTKMGKLAMGGIARGGMKLQARGEGRIARAKETGGGGSKLGGLEKTIGGAMASMGPLLGALTKFAPILSAVASGFMAIVKLMVDAEAQAKEFNKSLLDTASTSEFLHANFNDADLGAADLKDTLKEVRDASFDLVFNTKWGLMAEDHAKILSVLNQEGVSLKDLQRDAKTAGMGIGAFQQELVAASVTLSRNFGVPLQEINQVQAEMVRELGIGLKDTSLAFAQIDKSAADSGIASNKFFAIIRSVSQDMSLYNTRMSETVELMGRLGKVMNPRNAQKFLQTAVQGLKNMSQDDRLKLALLTGKKGKQIVQKDLERRSTEVYEKIGKAIGEGADKVKTLLSDPDSADELWKAVGEKAGDQAGALREAATEVGIDKTASGKGAYGQAFAMENLGAGATLDMLKAGLMTFSGGKHKTLQEGAGDIGMTKMSEMLGMSTQQLRGNMKLEAAIDSEKRALIKQAKKDMKAQGKSDAEITKATEEIQNKSTDDILNGMPNKKSAKELGDLAKSELDFAKEQTQLTDTITKKLERLIQWLMNVFYDAILDIVDMFSNLPGVGGSAVKQKREMEKAIANSGNATVKDAFEKSGRNLDKLRAELAGGETGKKLAEGLGKYEKDKNDTTGKAMHDAAESVLNKTNNVDLSEVAKAAGIDEKRATALGFKKNFDESASGGTGGKKSVSDLAKEAGISEAEYGKMLEKVLWGQKGAQSLIDATKAIEDAGKKAEEAQKTAAAGPQVSVAPANASMSVAPAGANMSVAPAATAVAPAPPPPPPPPPKAELKQVLESKLPTSDLAKDALASKPGGPDAGGKDEIAKEMHQMYTEQFGVSEEMKDGITQVEKKLKKVKIDKSFLTSDYQKTIEAAVLSAVQQALFEYYMYSTLMDKSKLQQYVKGGGTDAAGFLKQMREENPADSNAAGGVVTGVGNGMATVRAAAGEGLASVGKGERIVPSGGGGGGGINISVNGVGGQELAKIIQTKVVDGIAEYKRREKFN
jgi:hypothetical protein